MPLAGMKRKKIIETPSKASLQDSLWLLVLTNVGENTTGAGSSVIRSGQ